MNEDQTANAASGATPESPSAAQPSSVMSPAPGAPQSTPPRIALGATARTAGIVGVGALLVATSVFGTIAFRGSDGSSRGSGNIVLASSHSSATTSGAEITVTGNGQVEGTPDTATFSIGVNTTAHSAVAALEENNTQVSDLEHSLEASGVALKDIQTSWLNLYTNTDNRGDVLSFSADDELNVTMHNLPDLGSALDAAVHATGNGVNLGGISFSISNQSALLAAARAQAMSAARTEAEQLAAGGGLTLGSIVKVTDQENANPFPMYYAAGSADAAKSVPVQAGQQQISVQVTVVYQLKSS